MAYVRPIGFWLKLVDALVDDAYNRLLEHHGLTRAQWQLLDSMDAGPQTDAHLTQVLGPFAVHEDVSAEPKDHLDELVESGWVRLDADVWSLTETGTTALASIEAAVAETGSKALDGIPADEYSQMLDTLEHIAANYGYRASA